MFKKLSHTWEKILGLEAKNQAYSTDLPTLGSIWVVMVTTRRHCNYGCGRGANGIHSDGGSLGRFGPNRFAADVRKMANVIYEDLCFVRKTFILLNFR